MPLANQKFDLYIPVQTGATLPFYVSLGFMIYSGNNYQLISVSPVLGSPYALNAFGTQLSTTPVF